MFQRDVRFGSKADPPYPPIARPNRQAPYFAHWNILVRPVVLPFRHFQNRDDDLYLRATWKF